MVANWFWPPDSGWLVVATTAGLVAGWLAVLTVRWLPPWLVAQWVREAADLASYPLAVRERRTQGQAHRRQWRSIGLVLATVLLFAACLLRLGPGPAAWAAMGLCAVLLALTCIDLNESLLPDILTLPLLWCGLLLNAGWQLFATPASAVFGAAGGYAILWLLTKAFAGLTGKEGMGQGDFKLLAALGAWFGWAALPSLLLVSAMCGSAMGLYLRWRRGRLYSPYGPGLALAGVFVLFGGPA